MSLLSAELTQKGAWLSPCRKHRYTLTRMWDRTLPTMVVIGLNPSTADENQDDPTIRRCIGFAKREGYGQLLMLNLFSFRATDPADLKRAVDELDAPTNRRIVKHECRRVIESRGTIVCAWGTHGAWNGEGDYARIYLGSFPLHCFGHTAAGHPKHPLYLRGNQPIESWEPWRVGR